MNQTAEFEHMLARLAPQPELAQWVSSMAAELKAAQLKIQALTLELAHHKRLRFAATSEAFSADQRDLFEETCATDLTAVEAEVAAAAEQIAPQPKKPVPTGRGRLPDHLPRIEHRHEPASCTCGQCGSALTQISEDISEQL